MNEKERIQAALRRELDQLNRLRTQVLAKAGRGAPAHLQHELRKLDGQYALVEEHFRDVVQTSVASLQEATLATKHLFWAVKKGYAVVNDQLPS